MTPPPAADPVTPPETPMVSLLRTIGTETQVRLDARALLTQCPVACRLPDQVVTKDDGSVRFDWYPFGLVHPRRAAETFVRSGGRVVTNLYVDKRVASDLTFTDAPALFHAVEAFLAHGTIPSRETPQDAPVPAVCPHRQTYFGRLMAQFNADRNQWQEHHKTTYLTPAVHACAAYLTDLYENGCRLPDRVVWKMYDKQGNIDCVFLAGARRATVWFYGTHPVTLHLSDATNERGPVHKMTDSTCEYAPMIEAFLLTGKRL